MGVDAGSMRRFINGRFVVGRFVNNKGLALFSRYLGNNRWSRRCTVLTFLHPRPYLAEPSVTCLVNVIVALKSSNYTPGHPRSEMKRPGGGEQGVIAGSRGKDAELNKESVEAEERAPRA